MDCTHGLDRVHDQVEEYLLKLHAVTRDGRQTSARSSSKNDVLPAQLLLGQRHHVRTFWLMSSATLRAPRGPPAPGCAR